MPTTATPHPTEGTLRAYLDGELTSVLTLQCAIHLRDCPTCRLTFRGIRARDTQVANLLAITTARRRRRTASKTIAGLSAAAVIGALLSISLVQHPATHTRTAGASHVQDICCFNLDGGGRRDDGMLTVSRADQIVDCVVLYEDRAGKRAFSPHDPLRFISQPQGCTSDVIAAAAEGGSGS